MSSFSFERDDLRQELRQNTAGTIRFWPKVSGEGNVLASGTHSFVVVKDDGTQLQGSTNPTATTVNGVTRFDCAVSAISQLIEDCQVQITWQYGGATYFDVVSFDVVLWPFSWATLSLHDLSEERPDVAEVLTRHGQRLGLTSGEEAEEMASVYGYRARVELDALIRDQISKDRTQTAADFESAGTSKDYICRPRLVLNRERLNRIERKLTMRLIYAADASNPEEGEDESAAIYRFYRDEVSTSWRSLGPLKYDKGESLKPSETIIEPAKIARLRRVQA